MSATSNTKEFFEITFVTQNSSGALEHGTLSLIDNIPKATWSIGARKDQVDTFDTVLSEIDFRNLWDTVNILHNYVVADPNTKLSFTDNYLITIAFSFAGGQGIRNYLIPHDAESKIVLDWIRRVQSNSVIKAETKL